MTFKSTKYAKIMTDAKKNGHFDNIRFLHLRFHCKYYKKNFEHRSECPEIIGKIYSDVGRFSILNLFYAGWVSRQIF